MKGKQIMKDEEVIDPIKDIEAFEYTVIKTDGNESYNPIKVDETDGNG